MPLFFASSAIYPLALMPVWLRWVARFNPLTYLVEALRGLMVAGDPGASHWAVDALVLAGVFVALQWVAVRLYPRLVR